MQQHLSEQQVQELTSRLQQAQQHNDPEQAEEVIRQAAAAGVKAYRQWLQSDNGAR